MIVKTMKATQLLELKDKRIQQLEQDKEDLKASLSICQEQNRDMLGILKEAGRLIEIDGEHFENNQWNIDVCNQINSAIAKIESQNKEYMKDG